MKHSSLRTTFIVLLVTLTGSLIGAYSRSDNWDSDARKRKAAYIYLQSLDALMGERYNLYGELLTRAYRLNPDDPDLTARYGEWLLNTRSDDSAAIDQGFAMMLDSYRHDSSDYYDGVQLVNLTNHYRRWDENLEVVEEMHRRFPDYNEVTLQLGKSYLFRAMTGDTAFTTKALAVFGALEETLGKSAQLSELKIRTYAIDKDTVAIIDELHKLNAASPADPYTALTIGQVYNSLDMPDSARIYFDNACRLDSVNGNIILTRAKFYQQQGDSTTFDREVFRALESQDLELQTKLQLIVGYVGMLYNDSTQHARIDNLFDALLDVNPGEYDVHRLYGSYLADIGQFGRAAEQFGYAVALDGENREDWLMLAQLNVNADNNAKAIDALKEASRRFPDDLQIVRLEAVMLSIDGRTSDALDVLSGFPVESITDIDEVSNFHSLRGDLFYQENQKDSAFVAYEKAIAANPINYMALNNVAYFYAESDTLLDKAETYASKAVRSDPDNVTYLDTYAWIFYKKGDYAKAKVEMDAVLELITFDNAIDSTNTITAADVAANDDSIDDEVEEIEVVKRLQDGSAEIYDHAGDIYFRCGLVDRAVELWEMALTFEPDKADRIKSKIKHRNIVDNGSE